MKKNSKILITILKEKRDLSIALRENWYRIPTNSPRLPKIVKNKTMEYIAFYQGTKFKGNECQINYYAKVKNIDIVKRYDLFPREPINKKSNNDYYKIEFEDLIKLEKPIYSKKRRIIIFISSIMDKFLNANEINDLYLGSSIEEKMWRELKKNMLPAEREFHQKIKNKNYFIDFALFCKNIKLALECDGDEYHLKEKDVKYDKSRDNDLKSKGWNVLRYTSTEINNKIDEVIFQVKEAINEYGGIENEENYEKFDISKKDENQEKLFNN